MVGIKLIYLPSKILLKDVSVPQRDKAEDTIHERLFHGNLSQINMALNLKIIVIII